MVRFVPAITWDNPNATPRTDLFAAVNHVRETRGERPTKLRIGKALLRLAFKTREIMLIAKHGFGDAKPYFDKASVYFDIPGIDTFAAPTGHAELYCGDELVAVLSALRQEKPDEPETVQTT